MRSASSRVAGKRLRHVGEQARHRIRRFQVALGVARQPPPGLGQRRLVADAGEHVVERPRRRLGEAHAVGRDHRDVKRGGEVAKRGVVGFLLAQQVPLQLDARVRRAEEPDDPVDQSADAEAAAEGGAPDEGDQAARVAVELVERERALPFRGTQLHLREQAAQVPVAGARLDQHRQREQALRGRCPHAPSMPQHRQLGADDRFDPRPLRRHVKARRAVDAVAIEHRQRGYPSAAARSTSASGSEAPSRNENADAACSSIYTHLPTATALNCDDSHCTRSRRQPPALAQRHRDSEDT